MNHVFGCFGIALVLQVFTTHTRHLLARCHQASSASSLLVSFVLPRVAWIEEPQGLRGWTMTDMDTPFYSSCLDKPRLRQGSLTSSGLYTTLLGPHVGDFHLLQCRNVATEGGSRKEHKGVVMRMVELTKWCPRLRRLRAVRIL